MLIKTLILLIYFTTQFAYSLTCIDIFNSTPRNIELSNTQLSALNDVAKNGFKVDITLVKINNKERVVILLGEIHLQEENTHLAFKRLLPHFQNYAVEGLNTHNYLIPKLYDKLFNEAEKINTEINPIVKETYPSAIYEVSYATAAQEALNLTALELASFYMNGKLKLEEIEKLILTDNYKDLTLSILREINSSNPNIPELFFTNVISRVHKKELAFIFKKIVKDINDSNASEIVMPRKVKQLEENYQPSLLENIAFIVSYAASKVIKSVSYRTCAAIGCAVAVGEFATTGSISTLPLVAFLPATALYLSPKIMSKTLPTLFAKDRRDYYMTRNILSYLKENDEIDHLVVIVGKGHVDGIREQLKAQK